MATAEDLEIRSLLDQTDIIEVTELKLKYINRAYRKVSCKMYDYNCNVKLVVGSETFKAHREVLVDASDYFSAMFTHDMRERNDDVIQLQDVSPRGFSSMIEYFYHGYVTVDVGNIEGVVEVARFFHIEWLIRISCHYLVCHLAFEDYSLSLSLADQYVFGDIRSAILSFVGNSFYQLMNKLRFAKLHYDALSELLSGEWFISATEGVILQAIYLWIQHDPTGREQFRIPLLKLVRFSLLEPEELKLLEETESKISDNVELAQLVASARDYHAVPSRRCLLTSSETVTRGSIPYLVIYSGLEDTSVAEYRPLLISSDRPADIIREEVNTTFLETVFEFAAVAMLGDCLFIAGGYSREMVSSSLFYSYSPHRRCWTELSSMRQSRVSHSLAAAENLGLYAVAGVDHYFDDAIGLDRDKILDTVEFYSPGDNLWHEMPLLPFGVFNVGAAFTDGRLYITGGISDNPEHDVPVGYVNYCRPSDDGWTILSSMNHERHSHAISAHCGKLYVFGGLVARSDDTMGFVDCNFNEVYDPETDQWTDLVPTPTSFGHIHQHCVAVAGNIILLASRGKEEYFLCEFNVESGHIEETHPCGGFVHKMITFETSFPSSVLKDFIQARC